jgi:Zn-dependent peptidase ImmA (M78 family)
MEDEDEAEVLPFVGSMAMADGIASVVASIRNTLNVSISDFHAQDNPHSAFGFLRGAAEVAGIFVLLSGNLGSHHTNIDVEIFRGFALADPVAPFVVINEHDSKSAWSFSLLHELTHVWLGQTGVSGERAELHIERFCNDVASQFLLPEPELQKLTIDSTESIKRLELAISEFAGERNLSSSMVVYRLFRSGIIERNIWMQLSATFRKKWREQELLQKEINRVQKPPISPNIVRGHRLGDGLLSFVDRMMSSGALTTIKAGKVLGVKAQRVKPILDARGYGGIRRTA